MRSSLAIAKRILQQFAHDKRTIGLLLFAPMLVLWILSVLLGAGDYEPRLAAVDLPEVFLTELEQQDCTVQSLGMPEAEELLRANEVDAVLSMGKDQTLIIWAEGSDSTKTAASKKVAMEAMGNVSEAATDQMKADVEAKKAEVTQLRKDAEKKRDEIKKLISKKKGGSPSGLSLPSMSSGIDLDSSFNIDTDIEMPDMGDFSLEPADYLPVQNIDVTYLHGSDEWRMFDFYGPVFIGIFLFVFVFITSGMSLVNERGAGTMERFLASPVKPYQVLAGYVLGFGVLAAVQATVVLTFALNVLNFPNEGNIALVVLIAVLLALVSVTMGLLVSGLATSAFQVIQLMLIFVVPQILLSGLFDLSVTPEWMQVLGKCFPAAYGVDALREVMLRGRDLQGIGLDLGVLAGFVALFFGLAALKYRKRKAR